MKAIIEVDVPDYQIGQEVNIYFKDTMMIKSIVQEPKTGHWIRCDILQEIKCSECRMCFKNKTKYCPNCGAKMIEPQESEV